MSDVKELRDIARAENGLRSRVTRQERLNQNTLKMLLQPGKRAMGHLSNSSSDRYDVKNEPGNSRHGSENRSAAQGLLRDIIKPDTGRKLGGNDI